MNNADEAGEESMHFEVVQFHIRCMDHNRSLNLISKFLQKNISCSEVFEKGFVCVKQITQLLLDPSIDINLKKGVLKCLTRIPEKWQPVILDEISLYLDRSCFMKSNEHDEIRSYFENVLVLLANKSVSQKVLVTNFSRIAATYEIVIRKLSTDLKLELPKVQENEIAELYHFLFQTMIVFVDESCKHESLSNFPYSLYESVRDLMTSNKLNVNTINNCGLIIVALNYNFFDASSSLLLLKEFSEAWPIQCLAVCHGFMANASLEFYLSSNTYDLPVLLCDTIWHIYCGCANDSLVMIGVLKIILLYAKKINFDDHCVPKNCIKCLIYLLLSHLDHFLNSAKNLSKEALSHLVQQKNEVVLFELLCYVENNRRIDRKNCMILNFLSDVFSFSRIRNSYEMIIEDLRNAAKNVISSSYVCQVYLSLMISDYCDDKVDFWFDFWLKPLLKECSKYDLLLEHIFIPVVKLSNAVNEKLMEYCRQVNSSNYSIIIKFLLKTKTLSSSDTFNDSLSSFNQLNLDSNYWKNILPIEMMVYAIGMPNCIDALTTASLIIENIKGKEIFTPKEVDLLKFFTDSQFAVSKPDFRCKFLHLQLQILIKISQYFNSSAAHLKTTHISDFIGWIIPYSMNNLFPGASYERRNTALRICKILIDTNLWTPSFMNTYNTKILFNILSDGFVENELLAKYILLRFFSEKPYLVSNPNKIGLYCEAIEMIGGMRFSEHNTAAYVLELLCCMIPTKEYFSYIVADREIIFTDRFRDWQIRQEDCYFVHLKILISKLESQLRLCRKEGIIKYPFHGFLHVIRHLINQAPLNSQSAVNIKNWKILINNIFEVCLACNEFAVSAVSHSCPEGYLPDETFETEVNVFNTAQQTLLCNWRTVKGASLLLGDLVEKFSIGDDLDHETYLYKNTFIRIGDHLKTLIYQIKHKGSFKQVYIALCQFCKRCWGLSDCDINAIPKKWLKEIEHKIINGAEQLCLTRRSAGIPCIVLAILCTESDDKRKFTSNLLNEFMESMYNILNNKDADVESKIHALNIVRDLFVHKDMSEQINTYVERAVIIAINGFKSSNWNERNTSNLLLSAILTRMFGVSRSRIDVSWKNKMTGKIFFQKYPLLFNIFLLHLQQNECGNVNVQSALYPILLILARLYPSYADEWNDASRLSTYIPYIYSCSGNSIFKIRQLTVQAIIPFITRDIYVEHLDKIWSHVKQPLSENTKHGLLLQFEGLLQNIPELSEKQNGDLTSLSTRMMQEAELILRHSHSFVIKEKLLIILSLLLKRCYKTINFSIMKRYSLNENIPYLHQCRLNERSFTIAWSTFNVGLRYLESLKNDDVMGFVHLLESITQQETTKENLAVVSDFVIEIISKSEYNKNSILRNVILDNMENGLRPALLKSNIIYRYVLNKLLDDRPYRLLEMLYVSSEFLKQCQEEVPGKILSSFCKKYSNDTRLMVPFLSCIDNLLKKQDHWNKDYFLVIKSLLSLYHKLSSQDQLILRRFIFKCCLYDYLNTDQCITLDVWTFVVGNVSSADEEDFVFLKHTISYSSQFEDHFMLRSLFRTFFDRFKSTPLICGVGFLSWMIKGLGVVLNNVEKNEVFFGDLQSYFEDHLLICQLSSEYFHSLLEQSPSIINENLSKSTLSWIMEQSSCEERCADISTMRGLINFFARMLDKKTSSKTSTVSFTTRGTVEDRIIEIKLSLLTALKCEDE